MKKIRRRTKMIATLGPAIATPQKLEEAMLAGIDIFRANFSHGTQAEHEAVIVLLRQIAKKLDREIAIMADLQGPKIRIACFRDKKVMLTPDQEFTIDTALDDDAGNENGVGCDYKELVHDVKAGDTLLLDDGRLVFEVKSLAGTKIICRVITGGKLSNHKGINRLGGGLSAPALTEKDKSDIKAAISFGVDYIAVSFPRSKEDILQARRLVKEAGGFAGIIAKIERVEAIAAIDEIIEASDAVMVARGDLAVEIGDAEVPAQQKHIIARARALNRIAITATQMMESMIHNPVPTRAEVSDVANAVLDGTDAVMLSAETAVGEYPIQTIVSMARICLSAEKNPSTQISRHRVECFFEQPDEAIAMAVMYTANHMDIHAIVCLTESGTTPLLMSRIRSGIPIFGLTRHVETARKMQLLRGVYPVYCDFTQFEQEKLDQKIAGFLKEKELASVGQTIIISRGDLLGIHGCTNSMKIHLVQ